MAHVFLSYAREDREQASLVAAALEHAGVDVWWDSSISIGAAFDEEIEKELKEAIVVCVLWSRHSVDKPFVKNEARRGSRQKPLIPLQIDDVECPLEFDHLQTADLRGWAGDPTAAALNPVLAAIKKHIDDVPAAHALGGFVEYLKRMPSNSQSWPTWKDLEERNVWMNDPFLASIEEHLSVGGLAFLVGGVGSGKTVLTREVAFRAHANQYAPFHWDFEHFAQALPDAAKWWDNALSYARRRGRKPLIVLENVHLHPDSLDAILGLREASRTSSGAAVPLIATSRDGDLGSRPKFDSLRRATVELKVSDERASSLLIWSLEHLLHLDEDGRRQALRSVAWERYQHDFLMLRLALEAFDPKTRSLRMWAIEGHLRDRLAPLVHELVGADDFLYLASGLGRWGIATDFDAAAKVLGTDTRAIHALAKHASRAGLVSIDTNGTSCRFWHESLARSYADVFALERERWAKSARARFRGPS